ncbi:MAG TPA: NADH-quinone oxidoreductase subunit M [Terracidiphilus sp.]|jgi:NADH-quinone oxidoreductase subunit M
MFSILHPNSVSLLAWTIYLSFAGALMLALMPGRKPALSRWLALAFAVGGLALAVQGFVAGVGQGRVTLVNLAWVPSMGIRFLLAADGISRVLVLLTGLAAVAGVLFSWNIDLRTNEFFAFYLALIGAVYGVFLSFDLFLLFVFYEIAIVPKYFLIAIWGSTRREYGAMKLVIYSFAGSAMVLIGLLAAYTTAGSHSTGLVELAQAGLPASFQMWCFPLVFTGFAILAGMWPFHTWAPTGHVAAPTAASMLLAGVVMKLGAYGCLRVAIALFPRGLDPWGYSFIGIGSWRDVFAVLAIIGIVYGALVALAQTDFKFVIGYSSVSHMGFVLLGLMTISTLKPTNLNPVNQIGVTGAVLQMFSHGIIAGLLFAIVGRIVYDRTHTRQLAELETMHLSRRMPFAAWAFVIAGMASIGMPGFSGFVAELQVLVGAWKVNPWWVAVAGVGIVVGVAYIWRAMQKAFFSDALPSAHVLEQEQGQHFAAITWPEVTGVVLLAGVSLAVGLWPRILLDTIEPAVKTLLAGGGQ